MAKRKPAQPKLRIPKNRRKPVEPFWQGPTNNGDEGGITQSRLGGYFAYPERFRVMMVLGLHAFSRFNHYIEFGNMWHMMEEYYSTHKEINLELLDPYREKLLERYPMQRQEINKWYEVTRIHFPIYTEYWSQHEDERNRKNLFSEVEFRVAYKLPSGRTAYLRGKWDGVDVINGKVWLQENKTKSTIDTGLIEKNLTYDLQTMFYLTALRHAATDPGAPTSIRNKLCKGKKPVPLGGVRYNVIRRPLSGGKGSITRKKARKPTKTNPQGVPQEKLSDFYKRLEETIRENSNTFFHRWDVPVSVEDLNRFEHTTLTPTLENLCDDYEWWCYCLANKHDPFDCWGTRNKHFPNHCKRHYRLPYGINLGMFENGSTDVDNYLETGSIVGLRRPNTLFPELNEED